jgi:acyl transferase domain-containing protein
VSSFGLGGTTAHVILEQAPEVQAEPRSAGEDSTSAGAFGVLPWVLSARSEPALREQAARLRDLVAADASLSAADVGHSLVSTRSLFEHRAVVLSGGREEALAGLDLVAAGGDAARAVRGVATGPAGPVVFVFPGQGSQWIGMGRQLYAQSEVFARGIDECAQALAPWVDWSLVDVVIGAQSAASLDRIDVVQPALFAMMVSMARVWRSLGVTPDAVIGHSQGEIAAAHTAGAVTLPDAAKIVALRSRLLATVAGQGSMAGILLPEHRVRELLGQWGNRVGIAAVNGPNSTTVSGETSAVEELVATCESQGARARLIKSTVPGHSPLLDQFEDQLKDGLGRITPMPSPVAIYSTVTGDLIDPAELDAAYWFRNLRQTVRFEAAMRRVIIEQEHSTVIEISPHPVLQVAVEETADALAASPTVVSTLNKHDGSVGKVLASLAELHVRGVPVNWTAAFAADHPRRIDLPTYAFQRQRYWLTAPADTATTNSPSARASGGGARTGAAGLDSESSVLTLVCAETAALLSAKGADVTGADLEARSAETFKGLGFDSSMAVGLRNRLNTAAGVRLSATVAFTYPTAQTLARHLFSLLEPQAPDAPETVEETSLESRADDDLYELIDRGYV